MRMGNLLPRRGEGTNVMEAERPRLGMRHPTVVPTNFDPAEAERVVAATAEDSRPGERARVASAE
jgi:hypothetical protein